MDWNRFRRESLPDNAPTRSLHHSLHPFTIEGLGAPDDAVELATLYLIEVAEFLRLEPDWIRPPHERPRIALQFRSAHTIGGLTSVFLDQEIDGIPILEAGTGVHVRSHPLGVVACVTHARTDLNATTIHGPGDNLPPTEQELLGACGIGSGTRLTIVSPQARYYRMDAAVRAVLGSATLPPAFVPHLTDRTSATDGHLYFVHDIEFRVEDDEGERVSYRALMADTTREILRLTVHRTGLGATGKVFATDPLRSEGSSVPVDRTSSSAQLEPYTSIKDLEGLELPVGAFQYLGTGGEGADPWYGKGNDFVRICRYNGRRCTRS